jgi:hypothetical protein
MRVLASLLQPAAHCMVLQPGCVLLMSPSLFACAFVFFPLSEAFVAFV